MARCVDCEAVKKELARSLEAEANLRDHVAELQAALAEWQSAFAEALERRPRDADGAPNG